MLKIWTWHKLFPVPHSTWLIVLHVVVVVLTLLVGTSAEARDPPTAATDAVVPSNRFVMCIFFILNALTILRRKNEIYVA